jgi:hypothetical protein
MNLVDTVKLRRPVFGGASAGTTGRVGRDDRGNAVWEWAGDVADPSLEQAGLAIIDEAPLPQANVRINRLASRSGYNPYESGLIERKGSRVKRRDLHELSRWIEQRKARGEDTKG